jgi:glycosyl transferase family 1
VTAVDVVVPEGIDDPAQPSGGNAYDRHLCSGLTSIGWSVREHAVPGAWPRPDAAALAALESAVGALPDDAVVLIDGLVASTAPEVLTRQAHRLRLVVLVHMPLGHLAAGEGTPDARERERDVLSAASAIVATSPWTRRRLLELYALPTEGVRVAEPAVDAADVAAGTETGGELLCVAAVTFNKGHDVLLDALAGITDLSWRCTCVGSLERDPAFVESLRERSANGGLDDRVFFPGPRTGADLDRAYAAADVLVLASRSEAYGMVVIEALSRGVPVIATEVGGVAEAVGHGAGGIRPGLLVMPDAPEALCGALRAWLADARLRERLRDAARERRESLPSWSATTSVVADVLAGVAR